MQLPFFYIGKMLAGPDNNNPWQGNEVWWDCAGSAIYGLAGLLILLFLGLQLWGVSIGVRAAVLTFLGTALCYYMFTELGLL